MIELLSGGLVTARDASILAPGELQQAEDVMLKPGSLSIHKVPGRELFGTLPVSLDGLAYCAFSSQPSKVAAVGRTKLYVAPVTTGVFVEKASGAGDTLTAVRIEDRVALLSGGVNKVMMPDGTLRPMGMAPVTTAAALALTATGGSGIFASALLGHGYYEYWTVEVYKNGTEDVEGTFVGTPNRVNVATDDAIITISRPVAVNTEATHWRVYRGDKQATSTAQSFPVGFLVGTIPIATSEFSDGISTTTSAAFPTTYADAPEIISIAHFSSTVYSGAWLNPGNILADDGNVATSANVNFSAGNFHISALKLGGFGFSGIGDNITDISVTLQGLKSAAGIAVCQAVLSWNGGTSTTGPQDFGLSTSLTTRTASGTWGHTWTPVELTNGNFFVYVYAFGYDGGSAHVDADYVSVTVTYGSSNTTTTFPAIVIDVGPVHSSIGKNGQPPRATTGDIFQSSCLLNDVDNPRVLRWTVPGSLDVAPVAYSLPLDQDIKYIASMDSVCLVCQTNQVERMNFVPLESDVEFNGGRAKGLVDPDDGAVGVKAACKFSLGGEPHLFYAGYTSLRMSNGFRATTATDDINWPDMVFTAQLSKTHVVNNTINQEIQVFFFDTQGVMKCLRLSYSPSHLKNGKLKVVSLCNWPATVSAEGTGTDSAKLLLTGRGSSVYRENRGDASPVPIVPVIKTRELHLAGLGNAWELETLGVHHQQSIGTVDVSYEATQANYSGRVGEVHSFTPNARRLSIVNGSEAGEGIAVKLEGSDDEGPLVIDYLVVSAKGLGETVSLVR